MTSTIVDPFKLDASRDTNGFMELIETESNTSLDLLSGVSNGKDEKDPDPTTSMNKQYPQIWGRIDDEKGKVDKTLNNYARHLLYMRNLIYEPFQDTPKLKSDLVEFLVRHIGAQQDIMTDTISRDAGTSENEIEIDATSYSLTFENFLTTYPKYKHIQGSNLGSEMSKDWTDDKSPLRTLWNKSLGDYTGQLATLYSQYKGILNLLSTTQQQDAEQFKKQMTDTYSGVLTMMKTNLDQMVKDKIQFESKLKESRDTYIQKQQELENARVNYEKQLQKDIEDLKAEQQKCIDQINTLKNRSANEVAELAKQNYAAIYGAYQAKIGNFDQQLQKAKEELLSLQNNQISVEEWQAKIQSKLAQYNQDTQQLRDSWEQRMKIARDEQLTKIREEEAKVRGAFLNSLQAHRAELEASMQKTQTQLGEINKQCAAAAEQLQADKAKWQAEKDNLDQRQKDAETQFEDEYKRKKAEWDTYIQTRLDQTQSWTQQLNAWMDQWKQSKQGLLKAQQDTYTSISDWFRQIETYNEFPQLESAINELMQEWTGRVQQAETSYANNLGNVLKGLTLDDSLCIKKNQQMRLALCECKPTVFPISSSSYLTQVLQWFANKDPGGSVYGVQQNWNMDQWNTWMDKTDEELVKIRFVEAHRCKSIWSRLMPISVEHDWQSYKVELTNQYAAWTYIQQDGLKDATTHVDQMYMAASMSMKEFQTVADTMKKYTSDFLQQYTTAAANQRSMAMQNLKSTLEKWRDDCKQDAESIQADVAKAFMDDWNYTMEQRNKLVNDLDSLVQMQRERLQQLKLTNQAKLEAEQKAQEVQLALWKQQQEQMYENMKTDYDQINVRIQSVRDSLVQSASTSTGTVSDDDVVISSEADFLAEMNRMRIERETYQTALSQLNTNGFESTKAFLASQQAQMCASLDKQLQLAQTDSQYMYNTWKDSVLGNANDVAENYKTYLSKQVDTTKQTIDKVVGDTNKRMDELQAYAVDLLKTEHQKMMQQLMSSLQQTTDAYKKTVADRDKVVRDFEAIQRKRADDCYQDALMFFQKAADQFRTWISALEKRTLQQLSSYLADTSNRASEIVQEAIVLLDGKRKTQLELQTQIAQNLIDLYRSRKTDYLEAKQSELHSFASFAQAANIGVHATLIYLALGSDLFPEHP